jgi:hypothetical protein
MEIFTKNTKCSYNSRRNLKNNLPDPGFSGVHTEFLEEFYRYFNESSLVRYEMMCYFRELLLEKDKLIEKDILLYEKEQSEKGKS